LRRIADIDEVEYSDKGIIIIIIIMSLLSSDKTHMPPYTESR